MIIGTDPLLIRFCCLAPLGWSRVPDGRGYGLRGPPDRCFAETPLILTISAPQVSSTQSTSLALTRQEAFSQLARRNGGRGRHAAAGRVGAH